MNYQKDMVCINHWMLLVILLFSYPIIYGQGTGLILENETYDAMPKVPMSFSINKTDGLPSTYSLKQHCPTVVNQGQIGSCIGWAAGYGAFTIMQAQEEGWTDKDKITENAFSAMYIYNQVKISDCNQGSLFSDALKFLQTEGDCLSKDFDYPMDDCYRMPKQEHKLLAQQAKYVVRDYYILFDSSDKSRDKVNKVKVSIAENKPVIIGILIKDNFKSVTKEDKYWNSKKGDTDAAGGHAMVIVGYDDEKGAFEVMNSWGEEWGNDGYFWLKYDDFSDYCLYAYQLSIKKKHIANVVLEGTNTVENENNLVELGAEFVFTYPFFDEKSDELLYSEAKTAFNGKYYELKNTDWEENQRFQLISRNMTKDKYVYVFSIDPDKEYRIHWPKSEKYNQKFYDLNESALVPYDNVEIKVPEKGNFMIKNKPGADYLFVLYSDQPINDLIYQIEEIVKSQNDYVESMRNVFKNQLVPPTKIHYNLNEMKFTTNSYSEGYIVPVVLKIETKN